MSYLNIPASSIEDFTKAVISIWFRVPQTSMDAAAAAFVPNTSATNPANLPNAVIPPAQLNGIVPLVTFGKILDAYTTSGVVETLTVYNKITHLVTGGCVDTVVDTASIPVHTTIQTRNEAYKLDQSYIGVDCSPRTDPNTGDPLPPALCIRLQTGEYPAASGLVWETVGVTSTDQIVLFSSSNPAAPGGGFCGGLGSKPSTEPGPGLGLPVNVFTGSPFNQTSTNADHTDLLINQSPEAVVGTSQTMKITPDVWHHVIISFDLSGAINATGDETSLTSTCKLWVALDDVNYSGSDLPTQPWPSAVVPSDPNAVITFNAFLAWALTTSVTTVTNYVAPSGYWGTNTFNGYSGTPSSYTFSTAPIPSKGNSMGLPAAGEMVDHILHCEMAEFQMFTGVSLDTSVTANRRAFIGGDGRPVRYPAAAKVLGQKPDVAFVNSSQNWITGRDQGAAGHFAPTGKIKVYFPSPRLGV